MGLPLSVGHVLVRLEDGEPGAADAVLDLLEALFPTHTGRGLTRIGNVWEDPPTLTSESTWTVAEPRLGGASPGPGPGPAVSASQAFDVHHGTPPGRGAGPAGGVTAELLGAPEDVEVMLRTLTGCCSAQEEGRRQEGPQLVVRLRLGPAGRPPG
ncbi:hypothetical protein ACGF07_07370 [Kitasatospora sp. NPDC048194]|uniref:hypothetical protein n=1 Tax=Kitasatospora sp. NPDC048194 TaxID=3364045 RepID=UPI0037201EB4